MLPILNPSIHFIPILAYFLFLIGQTYHVSKSINPLLTFFNYANLDDLELTFLGFKHLFTITD